MISRLSLKKNFWSILALDHGLTVGYKDSVKIDNIHQLLNDCKNTVGSVVMTYGLARHVKLDKNFPLISYNFV